MAPFLRARTGELFHHLPWVLPAARRISLAVHAVASFAVARAVAARVAASNARDAILSTLLGVAGAFSSFGMRGELTRPPAHLLRAGLHCRIIICTRRASRFAPHIRGRRSPPAVARRVSYAIRRALEALFGPSPDAIDRHARPRYAELLPPGSSADPRFADRFQSSLQDPFAPLDELRHRERFGRVAADPELLVFREQMARDLDLARALLRDQQVRAGKHRTGAERSRSPGGHPGGPRCASDAATKVWVCGVRWCLRVAVV